MGKNERLDGNGSLLGQALMVFNKKVELTQKLDEIKTSANNALEQMVLQVMNTGIIPQDLRGKKCELLEIAKMAEYRGIPFLTLSNNILFIDGKMGWKSTYIISCINKARDRFSAPLSFRSVGKEGEKSFGKRAYTYDLNNNLIEGPTITLDVAERAGWTKKENSSWNTLGELMLSYRAATLFGRLYAPDILDGMPTIDELVDIYSVSGTLPKDAIDQKLVEILNESTQVVFEEVQKEVKKEVVKRIPKIEVKSTLETMCEDLENNGWMVSCPVLYKGCFFVKVEPETDMAMHEILLKWEFGKAKHGNFVKDVTSIMSEGEKNEYK